MNSLIWAKNLRNIERKLVCGNMAITFVKYNDLVNWSFGNALEMELHWNPQYYLIKLSDLLTFEEEKCQFDDDAYYQQVTLKLDGKGLEKRKNGFKKGVEIKTRNQSVLRSGQLVFSKIDARNGAFAIVGEDLDGAIVTKDFPAFRIDEQRVRAQYLLLLLLSEPFLQLVRYCSKGTTNRRRVDIEMLMCQRVPVPSLPEQDVILSRYNHIYRELEGRDVKIRKKETAKERFIIESLGLSLNTRDACENDNTHLTFVKYDTLINWNVNVAIKDSFVESTKYPICMIANLADDIILLRKGCSPRYDERSSACVLNQKCVRWDYVDTQFAKGVDSVWLKGLKEINATQEGDILINSTGDGTIGRSAVVDKASSNMQYDSHVLLLRVNAKKISPRYISILVNSAYGQKQIEELKSAKTTKQTELGVANLLKLVIPIPPLSVQEEVALKVKQMNAEIMQLKDVDEIKRNARTFFEKQVYQG